MREKRTVRDWLLFHQVATLTRVRQAGRDLKRRVEDEKGQTPTEYLMIVGLMASIILLVFFTWYWDAIKAEAQAWAAKVAKVIKGV